jgi:beta-glucosidase
MSGGSPRGDLRLPTRDHGRRAVWTVEVAAIAPTRFPDGFRWGTAASAYQFEGGNTASDWWEWERRPGAILHGDRSGQACDWWQNAEADFDRMAEMGLNAARISVEWSRLQAAPDAWDERALDRYLAMLRALRERGIEPLVTLNHFSLPIWAARRGGWTWSGIVPAFAAYAERFAGAASPLVDFWITINEPVGYLINAYLLGRFPPGRRSLPAFLRAVATSVRAHAAAYHSIHRAQPEARVGVAQYLRAIVPADPRSWFDTWFARHYDQLTNWAYLNALATGRLAGMGGWGVSIPEAAGTMDYVGVNYYTRSHVEFDLRLPSHAFIRDQPPAGAAVSDGGYGEVYPDGLMIVLRRARAYDLPIYVTENGVPDEDDDQRPAFIVDHLRRISDALEDGIPVRGYYHWALVDNFEWAEGWSLRFGLFALDPKTQARRARPSAALYAEICRRNAIP